MRGLPLIILGAGAAFLVSQSKAKKKKNSESSKDESVDLPDVDVIESDFDDDDDDEDDEEIDASEIGDELEELDELDEQLPGADAEVGGGQPDEIAEEDERVLPAPTPTSPAVRVPPRGPDATEERLSTIYSPEAIFMTPEIAKVLTSDSAASLPENRFYFYLKRSVQTKIFDRFVQRFEAMSSGAESPTLEDVVAREELHKINSGEDWSAPTSSFSQAKNLVWRSALGLAKLASINTGFSKILGRDHSNVEIFSPGPNLQTVKRESIGMPTLTMRSKQDKDLIAVDQRVELLAVGKEPGDTEHIIGRVSDLSPNGDSQKVLVEIIDEFQGKDVAPRLNESHNFKAGTLGTFAKKSPTGIYRVFPKGMS